MKSYGVVFLCLFSLACRGSSTSDQADADVTPDGDHTIQEVQAEGFGVGDSVTLKDVVVVAVDNYGGRRGSLYVMEPGGGEYSGIMVFFSGTEAAELSPGDLVDITGGVKDEFALEADMSGLTLTEVVAPDGGSMRVTKTGTGSVPAPQELDAWALADEDEAEKWESVLIRVANVSVVQAPRNVSSSDDTLKEMTLTGPLAAGSSLTEFGDTIAVGDCYSSVTGILDYFFDYRLMPRSADDFGAAGDSCPASEEGEALCGDGLDNDYDGFSDCEDFSCQDTVESCTQPATVVDVQAGTFPEGARVTLSSVVITAFDRDRTHLWVQDAGVTGENNGIYIYRGPAAAALAADFQVGTRVNISGSYDLFHDSAQVKADEVSLSGDDPVAVTVLDLASIAGLEAVATGAPYEGVIVRLSNMPVVEADAGFGRVRIGSATEQVYLDDTLHSFNPIDSDCIESVTGVVIMNTFDDYYFVAPRDAADITIGTCL